MNNMLSHTPKRITLLSVLSLAGVGSAAYLSQLYYELQSGTGGFSHICSVSQSMNCESVASSRYAELFSGMPVSSAVAGWFIGLFIISLIARNAFWRRESLRVMGAALGFGCAFAVYLLYVMVFVLKTYCLFCMGIEATLVISLVTCLSLKPGSFKAYPPDWSKIKKLALILGVALVAGIGLMKTMDNLSGITSAEIQDMSEKVLATPVLPQETGPSYPSEGTPGAPITIVEYSDFQCPHCRHGVGILRALLARYPGKIQVFFKSYPLDAGCNRKVPQPMHPVACEAARVADCAFKQGKYLPVYEGIFEAQESLVPGKPLEIALAAGLDKAQLTQCVASTESAADVSRDVEEGIRLNVESTPTFFVNGHAMAGALPVPVWDQIIGRLLHDQAH